MKYRDSDIILIRTNKVYRFRDLLPSSDYMFIKVLRNGKVLLSKGKLTKKIFKKKNKYFIDKNIHDIGIEFFSDYIYNVVEIVKEDDTAYQFKFNYKDKPSTYICSVYPCVVYDNSKSFDVIIRKEESRNSKEDFFTML